MTQYVCSVRGCKQKGDKSIFHGIPSTHKRREAWLDALKPFIDPKLDKNIQICNKHFKKSDYVPSAASPTGFKLLKSAVPTVTSNVVKKEVVLRPRHQSRRAASKEALKQMQILLEDEDDAVEIPDDDDEVVPIPVVVSHPKKKYKLTHRKSSDGNDREVLVLKSITPSITNHHVENNLDLECWVEELEPCQKERMKKLEEENLLLQSKLDELLKASNAEIIYKGELATVIEVSEHVQKTIEAVQSSISKPPIVLNSTVSNPPQPGLQLVMDPRLGLIVGAVQTPGPTSPQTTTKIQVTKNLQAQPGSASQHSLIKTTRAGRPKKQQTPPPPSPTPLATRSVLIKQTAKRTLPQPAAAAPPATRSRGNIPSATVINSRPTESTVEGGLSAGSSIRPKAIVDLTSDDGRPLPDSKEISFNKLQGKTFPSLVVVARPHLRVSDVNLDRALLDAKVKAVLMYAPTKFTEWLIQQGLVKSEQKCSAHTVTQLKLGMYSDVSKFPYSGGYVWISECCPQRFVSVFSGSIFEGSPHPPLVILKILYHWACQTNIQNVTQWVKVDNLYVKGMYTWLRSVCSVALQTHLRQLGGAQTKVEVGVISLGTTSQDGNSRQVKVEVLGVLETTSKLIRLRAIEPLADGDRNYKKRFSKILEPLVQWVHPNSTIVTDLTVDKATLHQMGFNTVLQSTSGDTSNSNWTVMEYLRRIVPRMFQNTLSLLSRQIIQQFLDELVWREWFGTTSMQAFDNLVIHLAEQTRFENSNSLIVRLNKVALNPFKNWALPGTSTTTPPSVTIASTSAKVVDTVKKRKRNKEPEPPKPAPPAPAEVSRPPKSTSPDVPEQMVPLENYYYGTIDIYPPKTNVTLCLKCPFCKESFNNNILLMSHLFKHAHNVSKDGQMCRYCLTSVPTANDLLKHIATAHPSETKHDNGFVCLICETHYMNPFVLGKHMSKEHCPSELPYQCGTCGYRCSNHKQAIDHFYRQHDNGPTIQCPFCLKSTTVFSSSRNIAQNMHYFVQHLQKHQRKQYAKRCPKCNLWFIQKDVLKDHQTKMHASQRGKTGLIPWNAPRNGVMVPKSKMDKYPCDAEGINFATLFYNVSKNLKCMECKGAMDTAKHFPSFESCQIPNCQYSTCCSNAMQEHNAKCNKTTKFVAPPEKLPCEMFCICGFSSDDGNQMAKHLAICERKSAYPSLADAKSASVTHSMLDVLGLVRKPEESDKKLKPAAAETTTKGADSIELDDEQAPLEVKNEEENKKTTPSEPMEVIEPENDATESQRAEEEVKSTETESNADVVSETENLATAAVEESASDKEDPQEVADPETTDKEEEKEEDTDDNDPSANEESQVGSSEADKNDKEEEEESERPKSTSNEEAEEKLTEVVLEDQDKPESGASSSEQVDDDSTEAALAATEKIAETDDQVKANEELGSSEQQPTVEPEEEVSEELDKEVKETEDPAVAKDDENLEAQTPEAETVTQSTNDEADVEKVEDPDASLQTETTDGNNEAKPEEVTEVDTSGEQPTETD